METQDNMGVRVASFSCYLDTAKENLVQRISAQENPIILTSAKTKTISTKPPLDATFSTHMKDSQDNLKNLRVDSFSYLKVPGPIQDPTAAFTFSHEIPKDGGEISVFGADKYFKMKLEYQTRPKPDSQNEGPIRSLPHVGSKTPSLCSDASSMNSQTALLQRNGSHMKQKWALGRRIFGGFGCQGPCFDKKDVNINDIVPNYAPKPIQIRPDRIHHPPRSPIPTDDLTFNTQHVKEAESLEESRNSIEVFGSSLTSSKGGIASNMERKLSILTWDAIPEDQNNPSSTIGTGTFCDDMASDASSDLFEIENISRSIYPVRTAGLDDMSSCMSPQSHYAPSEASIQWSVVTASAADYSSVVSDYNDETSVSVAGDVMARNNNNNNNMAKKQNGGVKEVQKTNRPGGLLGCKSHKSVEVAGNVCRKNNTNEKAKNLDLFGKSDGTKGRVKAIDSPQLP